MQHMLGTIFKIGLASLLLGAVLSGLDLSAGDILVQVGLTPDTALALLERGFAWALPNLVLGSLIIVPAWCVVYLVRPPRRD